MMKLGALYSVSVFSVGIILLSWLGKAGELSGPVIQNAFGVLFYCSLLIFAVFWIAGSIKKGTTS